MNKEKDYSTFKVSRKLMEAINGTKRRNVQIELSKDAGHRVPPPQK